ncbi:MAG: hypothetical protein MZV63_19480, partial [Marinilabiliales bacterium]|nr:hypothetical protein [Marinilabiliales bacterium]
RPPAPRQKRPRSRCAAKVHQRDAAGASRAGARRLGRPRSRIAAKAVLRRSADPHHNATDVLARRGWMISPNFGLLSEISN